MRTLKAWAEHNFRKRFVRLGGDFRVQGSGFRVQGLGFRV